MLKSKKTQRKRQWLAVALLCGASSLTGCSSTGSGLFARSDTPATEAASGGGIGQSVANLSQGARAQASSMGMAVKSAVGKGRDRITGMFGGNTEVTNAETGTALAQDDPTSLQNQNTSVDPEVFVANGQLWESTGKFDRAMENYTKALEREPENGPALASVARLHYRQGNYEQSIGYFERAIAVNPEEAGLYNDMGLAYSKMGKSEQAVAMIQKAIETAPTKAASSRFGNNLATVLFEAGQTDQARTALMNHNSPIVAHYNMAYLQYTANEKQKTLEELGKALSMSGSAGQDPAAQQAVKRSQELFEQLGGPATQIAQQLPELYGSAKQTGEQVAKLGQDASKVVQQMQGAVQGVTATLSDNTVAQTGASSAATPAASVPATTPGAEVPPSLNQTADVTPPTATPAATRPTESDTPAPTSGSLFSLPPMPAASVAEQPGATQLK